MNKYTISAIALFAILVGGALIYSPSKNEDLKDNKSTTMLETISANDFLAKNNEEDRIILDVRTSAEYEAGHIKDATNIDISSPTFTQELNALDKSTKYSIYCRSGNRSGQALSIMEQLGFEDVIDLGGGVIAWDNIGQELCTNC